MKERVIPILNNEYKVVVCWGSPKQIEKILKDWGHKESSMTGAFFDDRRGATFYAKDCQPVIALPCKPKTPEQIGTLAHEAVHAVTNIFNKIEERTFDEVFAHSVGAIVREVLKTPN